MIKRKKKIIFYKDKLEDGKFYILDKINLANLVCYLNMHLRLHAMEEEGY